MRICCSYKGVSDNVIILFRSSSIWRNWRLEYEGVQDKALKLYPEDRLATMNLFSGS